MQFKSKRSFAIKIRNLCGIPERLNINLFIIRETLHFYHGIWIFSPFANGFVWLTIKNQRIFLTIISISETWVSARFGNVACWNLFGRFQGLSNCEWVPHIKLTWLLWSLFSGMNCNKKWKAEEIEALPKHDFSGIPNPKARLTRQLKAVFLYE